MQTRLLIGAVCLLLGSCGNAPPVVVPPPPLPPPSYPSANAPDAAGPTAQSAEHKAPPLTSDEGMWLLSDFPSERLAALHGFLPTAAFLDHVRLSAVRLAGGCSGSFVSKNGLVMTNHHCASRCIEQLSSGKKDYVAQGFYAKSTKDEVACPEIEVNQLIAITDVTQRLLDKTRGLDEARYNEVNKAEQSKIEKECATSDDLRCDVVTLYHGGQYHLYKYRRYQDVRLVFAPEFATAFFGGDPDNFMFPRYDLDVSFLRVYQDNKPLASTDHFTWSRTGVQEGDLTFVAGHPWGTSRELTIAELEFLRDFALPARLDRLAEARGLLTEFQTKGAEQKRISGSQLFSVENSLKAVKGRAAALRDADIFASKVRKEQELRVKVMADPALSSTYGSAWDRIRDAELRMRALLPSYQMLEQGLGFWSDSFEQARRLVRAAHELPLPSERRLREFADSQLPAQKQRLFSPAPVYDELEILTLTHSLTRMRAELGADDVEVKRILGKDSPRKVATRLVKGTRLTDPKVRKALFEGGQAALDASHDPMIELAKSVDPAARAARKVYEDEVEAVVKKNSELVARVRFLALGTSVYPDATATLRLSFGEVRGFPEGDRQIAPITRFAGAFERATGQDPFALPTSWLLKKDKLDLATPLNFCTTNDIIGGNSGSPVINRAGEITGLVFDGNIHSLGGDYFYDPKDNRAVAVHSAGIVEALGKIYGAERIVAELLAAPDGAGSP